MLNRNDPLIGAVQEVMKKNQAERDAVKAVNEKFGVVDRRALPHEQQANWDAAYAKVITEGVQSLNEAVSPAQYSDKQKKLAAIAGNKKKIDGPDLAAARKGHASHIEEEQIDEVSRGMLSRYIKKAKSSSRDAYYGDDAPTSGKRKKGIDLALKKKWGDKEHGTPEPKVKATNEETLEEKAVSKAQHRFFGLVRGIQKGKAHGSAKAEKAASSMSSTEVRKFAKTKEKGLPEKK